MNLPNKLTILRCLMIPVIILFMVPLGFLGMNNIWNRFVQTTGMEIAFVLFCLASITDFLDGYIARKKGLVTNFGKFLDPIADKILVIAVLIALVKWDAVHAIVPIIILFREFAVTGMRLIAIEKGIVIAASKLGKFKTVSQIVAIIILYINVICIDYVNLPVIHFIGVNTTYLGQLALFISVVLTIWSGFDYFKISKKLLSDY